ncbi:uncharacterized protein PG986_011767 [Apiospora aurea]|uniref:Uncharacterized protein n=1 Tax=Apiospora aurea TaxID=335848 RepID=A0ABR1PYG6_9PEZI
MDPAAARREGARILDEVEEESLEQLINHFRSSTLPGTTPNHPQSLNPPIPIPSLATLIARHHQVSQTFPPPLLSLSGRYLPFLYHLVSTLIAAPHNYAVTIVDADHRFDVTRLVSDSSTAPTAPAPGPPNTAAPKPYPATKSDLKHLYVYRPARSAEQAQVQASLAAAREYMLYAPHASQNRAWWGSVVVVGTTGTGGGGGGGEKQRQKRLVADVVASWKGWLHVQRQEVPGFGVGMSVEEALGERERRAELVRDRGWEARAREGAYAWGHA